MVTPIICSIIIILTELLLSFNWFAAIEAFYLLPANATHIFNAVFGDRLLNSWQEISPCFLINAVLLQHIHYVLIFVLASWSQVNLTSLYHLNSSTIIPRGRCCILTGGLITNCTCEFVNCLSYYIFHFIGGAWSVGVVIPWEQVAGQISRGKRSSHFISSSHCWSCTL